MIGTLSSYLGKNISLILTDESFSGWSYSKTVLAGFGDPIFCYEFNKNGMEVQCSNNEIVNCIFLRVDTLIKDSHSSLIVPELQTLRNRSDVRAKYGEPTSSKGEQWLEYLGAKGAFDRYTGPEVSIHFQYQIGSDRVSMITLMVPGLVPESS